jgi:hypothetical protein
MLSKPFQKYKGRIQPSPFYNARITLLSKPDKDAMLIPVGGGRMWGKGEGGGMWCKYCVHMYVNGKMRLVKTIPGMGVGR